MSDDVLADLDFPDVDIFLGVGSGTHGVQTAKVLAEFEKVLIEVQPEVVVVAGDVNSTLACALAASQARHRHRPRRGGPALVRLEHAGGGQPRPHRPAGRRPVRAQPRGGRQPEAEGICPGRVYNVGNTMIDSLRRCEKRARAIKAWTRSACASASTCS